MNPLLEKLLQERTLEDASLAGENLSGQDLSDCRLSNVVFDRALRPLAQDQVGFDPALLERRQQAYAKYGTCRTCHRDDQARHRGLSMLMALFLAAGLIGNEALK